MSTSSLLCRTFRRLPRRPLPLPLPLPSSRLPSFPPLLTCFLENAMLDCSPISPLCFFHHFKSFCRLAQDHYSDDPSDKERDFPHQSGCSTPHNLKEWKGKLTMLLRNQDEQEVVSKVDKDRHDFEQLSAMASQMGLHSRQYSKVIVFSKIPLPNYRHDLDDERLQREVVVPFDLQNDVDILLGRHLAQKPNIKEVLPNSPVLDSAASMDNHEVSYMFSEPSVKTSGEEDRIRQWESFQLQRRQQDWQDSPEGQKMLDFRRSLPAHKERDALLKTISENQVVVVSGETGCGKTTQLPQYILESEFEASRGASCSIICTQPRRISAMSVSERVAAERGEELGESVGYKVRLEGMRGKDTRLLFCTTGILLRRLLIDCDLRDVSHVIIDEIHERGMNEDFLLVVLKDLLPRRPDLRLILMSATMNAELFSSYFGGAPMLHIPGFTYPVRAQFLEDILEATGYKLTPYNQIDDYGQEKAWKMHRQTQRKKKSQIASAVKGSVEGADFVGYSRCTQDSLSCWNPDSIGFNLIEHVLCHICKNERPGAILVFMTGWDDINSLKDQLEAHTLLGDPSKVLVLACHGSMDSSEQRLIFNRPPDGVRKIVLATNMAETSITINDVVFVVDCGKVKETSYDALNNTSSLLPKWISKAAAHQRKGRAGRVQPGECYHLYPRCVYDAFVDYQLPELLRSPLESLCLQIKSLQLGSIADFLSKALEAPEALSVQNAIDYLKTIGALDENENLTVLGQNLSMLPVEPKLGKMLILGAIFKCLDPILTIVAGLSVKDPFQKAFDRKDPAQSAKAQFSAHEFSDHLALVRAFDGWKDAENRRSGHEYCWTNFLSLQTLKAIDSLRMQLFSLLIDTGLVDGYMGMAKSNEWSHDEHLIRAIICAGLFPSVCSVVNKEKSVILKTMEDGQVHLNANSVNALETRIPFPWLVFNSKMKVNTVLLWDSTAVSDSVLLLFGGRILRGEMDGHLKMFGGYMEFFMKPDLSNTYLCLKRELDELVHSKLADPYSDVNSFTDLLSAVRMLISGDRCEGRFMINGQPLTSSKTTEATPVYNTRQLENNQFHSTVTFDTLEFMGQPCTNKEQAEKDAAGQALQWLIGGTSSFQGDIGHLSMSDAPGNNGIAVNERQLSATQAKQGEKFDGVSDYYPSFQGESGDLSVFDENNGIAEVNASGMSPTQDEMFDGVTNYHPSFQGNIDDLSMFDDMDTPGTENDEIAVNERGLSAVHAKQDEKSVGKTRLGTRMAQWVMGDTPPFEGDIRHLSLFDDMDTPGTGIAVNEGELSAIQAKQDEMFDGVTNYHPSFQGDIDDLSMFDDMDTPGTENDEIAVNERGLSTVHAKQDEKSVGKIRLGTRMAQWVMGDTPPFERDIRHLSLFDDMDAPGTEIALNEEAIQAKQGEMFDGVTNYHPSVRGDIGHSSMFDGMDTPGTNNNEIAGNERGLSVVHAKQDEKSVEKTRLGTRMAQWLMGDIPPFEGDIRHLSLFDDMDTPGRGFEVNEEVLSAVQAKQDEMFDGVTNHDPSFQGDVDALTKFYDLNTPDTVNNERGLSAIHAKQDGRLVGRTNLGTKMDEWVMSDSPPFEDDIDDLSMFDENDEIAMNEWGPSTSQAKQDEEFVGKTNLDGKMAQWLMGDTPSLQGDTSHLSMFDAPDTENNEIAVNETGVSAIQAQQDEKFVGRTNLGAKMARWMMDDTPSSQGDVGHPSMFDPPGTENNRIGVNQREY